MVDRFTITAAEQDPWIDADPSGQWVRYSDYAALEAQLAALSAENERLRKDAERYRLLRRGNIDNLAVVRGLGTRDYGLNVVLHTYSKEIDGDELDNAIDDAIRAKGIA